MPRDVVFECLYFTGVSPSQVGRLRDSADALSEFLAAHPGQGLDRYGQAVPYLLTGRTKGAKEPIRWLTGGGEVLGRNDAGPVRYLSPEQVLRLADALDADPPDELGHDTWDEAAMDEAGVYPGGWVERAEDVDELGTIRELYAYVRDFFAERKRDGKGVIVHRVNEVAYTEDDDEPPAAPAPEPERPVGAVVAIGEKGRWYTRADASAHPQATPARLGEADAAMGKLGYRHVGDFTADEPDVLRAYVSADGTTVAIAYWSDRGLGSWTFLSRLGDALVVASDAFTQEVKKTKLFAASLSKATPAELDASVHERRAALAEKHGAPVALEATLFSAAQAWDSYGLKLRVGRR